VDTLSRFLLVRSSPQPELHVNAADHEHAFVFFDLTCSLA
jgi:hypothetical protein